MSVAKFEMTDITIMPIVDGIYEACEAAMPMLEPAIERYSRNVSADDVRLSILSQRALLWIVRNKQTPIAAFTTSIVNHPQRTTLMIEYMSGKHMPLWAGMALNVLRNLAKEGKLDAIEADGRLGFSRMAAANGFTETHRHFEMEIE